MAEFKEQVLDILEEVCENDIVKENLDVQLFEEGILDSFAVVSLLVEFQERLDIEVSISDFDRDEWATPNMVIKSWKKSDEQSKIWSDAFSIGPFAVFLLIPTRFLLPLLSDEKVEQAATSLKKKNSKYDFTAKDVSRSKISSDVRFIGIRTYGCFPSI